MVGDNTATGFDQCVRPIGNAPSNLEPGYWLVNARIGIGNIDDRWALSAWVKNLTKSQYRIYVNDLPDFGWVLNAYGPPRVFGATLGFKF